MVAASSRPFARVMVWKTIAPSRQNPFISTMRQRGCASAVSRLQSAIAQAHERGPRRAANQARNGANGSGRDGRRTLSFL